MSENGQLFLVVQRGGDIGTCVALDQRQVTIGRNSDNVIVLAEPLISRYHAVIHCDHANGYASITDLGSTNGVTVNDSPIDPGLPHPLRQRDIIVVGHTVYSMQIRPDHYQPSRPDKASDPDATQYLELKNLFSR